MTKRVALYLRVSTDSQTVENQRLELQAVAERLNWTIVAELADEGISGAKGRDQRPGFDRLMQMVTRKQIDLIACWSVDRLGRSLQHLVTFLGEIKERKVDLYLHTQGLDTSTPAGTAMFSILSVFADFEREMIRSRIMAGLARSEKKSGRPPLDPDKVARIERIVRERLKQRLIKRLTRSRSRALDVGFNLSRDTVNSTDSSLQAVGPQRSPNLSASDQPLSILRDIAAIVEPATPNAHPFGKILGSEIVTATRPIFRRVLRLSSLNTRTKS